MLDKSTPTGNKSDDLFMCGVLARPFCCTLVCPAVFMSPQNIKDLGFLGGTVVKNLPANAGDTGLSPGPGRSHMPWSN